MDAVDPGVQEPEDPTLGGNEDFNFDFGGNEPPEEITPNPDEAGENRYQRIANERRELERQLQEERDRSRLLQMQTQMQQQPHRVPDSELTQEELDARWRQDLESKLSGELSAARDERDQAAFDRLCMRLPQADKMRDEVEKTLREARQAGQNPTREGILQYLIGKKAVENAGKPTRSQKQSQRQLASDRGTIPSKQPQSRPEPTSSGNSVADLEARLKDVRI